MIKLGHDKLGDGTVVSTVATEAHDGSFLWIGLHNHSDPTYETLVFDKNGLTRERRTYVTEATALAGHKQAVVAWSLIAEPLPWQPLTLEESSS